MARRAELLEFAVLGLLHESPMHGYELRKRLNTALGAFRALSYGSLYPCLRDLLDRDWIAEATGDRPPGAGAARPHRLRAHADGKEQFQELVDQAGPTAWEDDSSTSTSPSSPAPRPRSGCASSRAVAAGSRSGSTHPHRAARPRARWTTTPPSCSGTAWTRPSARSAGSTS